MQSKPVPIPLGSNPARSRQASDTRVINGFIEQIDDSPRTKAAIYGVAGLTKWVTIAGGLCRGMIEADGLLYVLSGSKLLKVTTAGVATEIGQIPGTDTAIMARNAASPAQVSIVVNNNIYNADPDGVVLNYRPDLIEDPLSVDWLDGYFIYAFADGRFFISGINDTTIDPLDFATAEGDPDGLVRAFVLGRELLLMGSKSIEVWANTGAADFPFSRLAGAVIKVGLGARLSVAKVGQTAYFVDDKGIVRRMTGGYQAERVSNYEVERLIQALGDFSGLEAFSYTQNGHEFYVLSSETWTWVFDQSTGQWHERRTGVLTRWQAQNAVYFNGSFVVGSRISPDLFLIDETRFDEDGEPLIFTVRFPIVDAFPMGATVFALELDMETGVGTETGFVAQPITWDLLNLLWDSDKITLDQTIDHRGDLPNVPSKFPNRNPIVSLRWSDDGGRSWTTGSRAELGRQAEVRRVRFNRLGSFGRHGRILEVTVSASTFRALLAAYITANPRVA